MKRANDKNEYMTLAAYREKVGIGPGADKPTAGKSKYNARPCVIDGIRFASILEAAYYLYLQVRVKQEELSYFLRQVPIYLPGNVRYVVDFLEFGGRSLAPGGARPSSTHRYVDVKGTETDIFRLKRNQVHACHPGIFIHCVTREDIDPSYIATATAIRAIKASEEVEEHE